MAQKPNIAPPAPKAQSEGGTRFRVELLITLLGAAGLLLFFALYNTAFPSSALRVTRSRAEITQLANQYMADQGYNLGDYQFSLTFGTDGYSSIFLQRTLGIAETNRLIREENLPLWYWRARWFKVQQQEEFAIYLMPDGKLCGFNHTLPEAEPGAQLEQEPARDLAAQYLMQQGWDLSRWELVDASSSDLPARRDHAFSWKRRDFDVGDSQLRLMVNIQGDRVGYFDYAMRVPEAFDRDFSEQRNLPSFITNTMYFIGMEGFSALAIIFLFIALIHRVNPLRRALPLALMVGFISLLSNINSLFLAKAWYSTTQDWTLFWLNRISSSVWDFIFTTVFIALILAGGQYIARQVWPHEDKLLPRGADRWGILARSGWRGVMVGGLMLGYAVLFYLVATVLFGSWTPMDMSSTSGIASPMPFIGPLESGLLAASQEEIIFRLVGITLIYWLTRKKWLALLIPGAIWAFAHLSYIRDPFYLRGIELLITAVFVEGLIFLYYDLTTTIVAHMTYNAMLGTLPLLRSNDPYLVFSGVLVILVLLSPVILGLARSYARRSRNQGEPLLRPAVPGDLPSLLRIPSNGANWQSLLSNSRSAVVVLEVRDQVIGAAAGEVTFKDGEAGHGNLLAVWVDPQWRGQFWGSRMVEALWRILEPLGAATINARVDCTEKPALAFLSTIGWQATEQTLTRQSHTLVGGWLSAARDYASRSFRQLRNRFFSVPPAPAEAGK